MAAAQGWSPRSGWSSEWLVKVWGLHRLAATFGLGTHDWLPVAATHSRMTRPTWRCAPAACKRCWLSWPRPTPAWTYPPCWTACGGAPCQRTSWRRWLPACSTTATSAAMCRRPLPGGCWQRRPGRRRGAGSGAAIGTGQLRVAGRWARWPAGLCWEQLDPATKPGQEGERGLALEEGQPERRRARGSGGCGGRPATSGGLAVGLVLQCLKRARGIGPRRIENKVIPFTLGTCQHGGKKAERKNEGEKSDWIPIQRLELHPLRANTYEREKITHTTKQQPSITELLYSKIQSTVVHQVP